MGSGEERDVECFPIFPFADDKVIYLVDVTSIHSFTYIETKHTNTLVYAHKHIKVKKIIFGTIYHFPSDPAAISSHKRSYCFVLPDNLLLDQGPAL